MAKTESKPTNTGKCGRPLNSAYLELMKEDEDWRELKDASERRKIQNRLAQRAYRRNLRSRNQEVEVLREQLLRLREVDGKRADTTESNRNSKDNKKPQLNGMKTRSRASPKTKEVQAKLPSEWIPSGYEMGRSVSPLGEGNSGNPQFFDSYQDSDDSTSLASGSSPGHHSLQSEETNLDTRIIYDDHTGLPPLPSTYSSMCPCERGCSSSGEDPSLPMHPFHPTLDYESSGTTTNHQHLAPIPHQSSSRYATPIEFSYEEESSFCYGYPTNATPSESGGPLVSIPPSITDFPAATPGFHTHATGGRPRDYTMSSPPDFANIHPALMYSATSPPPPPGSQQPAWPNRNDCTVSSLLHIAVAGGYMETVRLILDQWPELDHMVDSEGYPAV
ncbi:hypothetical protein PG996_011536 [Apiospora saccharicola]|uniref:BZIP domain-containing protein n=1 Tax=Apiospora saccharicola TaxID=335842 RepID=A0ABR1UFB5_9PEZI